MVMVAGDTTERDEAIRKAIEETLKPTGIGRVIVHEDEGHGGTPIYRITIVLASDDERLQTGRVMRLWDAVMRATGKFDDVPRFPVFTFMTPTEAEAGDAAA